MGLVDFGIKVYQKGKEAKDKIQKFQDDQQAKLVARQQAQKDKLDKEAQYWRSREKEFDKEQRAKKDIARAKKKMQGSSSNEFSMFKGGL